MPIVLIAERQVLSDIRNIVCDAGYTPTNPRELCNRIFVTCYMGTENSSAATRDRAAALAQQIGRWIQLVAVLFRFN